MKICGAPRGRIGGDFRPEHFNVPRGGVVRVFRNDVDMVELERWFRHV